MKPEIKTVREVRLARRSCLIRRAGHLACLLAIPLFLVASKAQSQTIWAYQYPQGTRETLSQGGTIYINPADQYNFPMVYTAFYVTNPPSTATSIAWSIDVDYVDQSQYEPWDADYASLPLTETWTPSWGGDSAGGTATVEADFYDCHDNSVGSATFSFKIKGENQTPSDDSAAAGNPPWFFPYIISVESCHTGYQFAPSPLSSCMLSQNIAGDPLWNGTGNTDGIGVAQIDMTNHFNDLNYPSISDVYWNYEDNIGEALDILSGLKESSACGPELTADACKPYAYDFWDRQVYQMCTYKGGTYKAGSGMGMGSCSVVKPITNPPDNLPDCPSFDGAPLTAGQPSGYRDAEWITDYNGTGGVPNLFEAGYYIVWNKTGHDYSWTFNILQNPSSGYGSYVGDVCNSSSY